MNTSRRNQPRVRPRLLLASAGLLCLALGAILLILGTLGIVSLPGTWSSTLGIAFAALGTVIAFSNWLFPFPSLPPGGLSSNDPVPQLPPASVAERDLETFRRQVERGLDRRLRKGALIVYTSERQVAHEIKVVPQLAWMRTPNTCDQLSETYKETVRRCRVGAGYVCAAVYRNLDPDDYMVWSDENHPTSVPVFAKEATVVDWR